ncbi:MAG TPA: hypothetical protein PK064_12445, partial [Bacteroidales bacterium]|nr:hypothetical protein [Bacteroidales bacterium]
INDFQDIDKLPHNINFPAFIKGQEVNSWRKNFGGTLKGIKVNDRKELLKEVEEIISKKVPIIVQEIITGPDTNHFKYCSYTDARGNILAEFTLRKIRQWPVHFGVGAVVESVYKPELIDVGRKLFTSIGYKGIGSAEFKIDERDGKLKLIEINPRYWQQNYLATACGINFPYINYFDLVEGNYGCARSFKEGIKWINIYMDFNALAAYKKEGVITFYEWIKSLKGKKIYHDFIWTDPLPLFYEIRFGKKLYKIPGYLWKKLFRK